MRHASGRIVLCARCGRETGDEVWLRRGETDYGWFNVAYCSEACDAAGHRAAKDYWIDIEPGKIASMFADR